MPSPRTWIIGGLSAAALIAAGAFVLTQLPGPTGTTAADSTHSAQPSAPATGDGPAATDSGSGGGSGGGSDSGSGGSSGGGGNGKATPPPAGKRYTTEVVPANPTPTPALPPSTPAPSPISAPLPKTASATGALVAGYPEDVLPQAPGSRISTSSVASQPGHLQVTLEAKTDQGVTDVLAFYRAALAAYGMYDSPAPAVAGSTAVTFQREGNAVTLTVTPAGTGTSYVLYGAFTVPS